MSRMIRRDVSRRIFSHLPPAGNRVGAQQFLLELAFRLSRDRNLPDGNHIRVRHTGRVGLANLSAASRHLLSLSRIPFLIAVRTSLRPRRI